MGQVSELRRPYGGVSAAQRVSVRREALLDAGLEVVGRDGVAGFSIEAVCAQASLGKRYFYESFSDRDAMLVELVDKLFADLRERMLADIAAHEDRAERSAAVVRTLVEVLSADQRRSRLYAECAGHPVLSGRREQAVSGFSTFIADQVLPTGAMSGIQRELAVRLLVSGTTDLVTSWLRGDLDASDRQIIDAVVSAGLAIAARQPGPAFE